MGKGGVRRNIDDKHFYQLVEWLENNIDIEAGMPVIFDDDLQYKLEQALMER